MGSCSSAADIRDNNDNDDDNNNNDKDNDGKVKKLQDKSKRNYGKKE